MKFKKNFLGERELSYIDADSDVLEVTIKPRGEKSSWPTVIVAGHGDNRVCVAFTRKQLRTLANKILKELDR